MNNLKKFINVMDALIRTIIRLCPEEKSIKVGYEYFNLGRSVNQRKVWELFITNIYPMKETILAQDEAFFLDSHIDKDILEDSVSKKVSGEAAFQSILNIKDAWVTRLTDVEKEKIWKALIILIKLSDALLYENSR